MTTYSFVNAATIARDLARHPNGAAITDELLLIFGLGDDELADLDDVPTPPGTPLLRDRARLHATQQPGALPALAAGTAAVGLLDTATIGGVDELCRWVRTEVLSHAWHRSADLATCRWPVAVAHVCDGLLAAWAGPSVAAELGRPWQDWAAYRAPACVDDPALARIVAALGIADAAALDDVAAAMTRWRVAGRSWSAVMHDACWAIDLTGRGRGATVAQLAAARELLQVTTRPRPDVVAAVTMAVHATTVADVLPDAAVAAMCRPLFAHLPVVATANVQSHGRNDR